MRGPIIGVAPFALTQAMATPPQFEATYEEASGNTDAEAAERSRTFYEATFGYLPTFLGR